MNLTSTFAKLFANVQTAAFWVYLNTELTRRKRKINFINLFFITLFYTIVQICFTRTLI